MQLKEQDIRIFNTCKSYQVLCKYDNMFFKKIKEKLLSGGAKKSKQIDFTNISGALGELRCYGYLLNAVEKYKEKHQKIEDISVSPILQNKDKQSDFKLSFNSEEIMIETSTLNPSDVYWDVKQQSAAQIKRAKEVAKLRCKGRDLEKTVKRVTIITEIENSPYWKKIMKVILFGRLWKNKYAN